MANSPASLINLRFVQCFTTMAKGRTRGSISTYVLIMRVFSSANVLLTFISHASFSSGSHIRTMGTLALDTQMTFCIPSTHPHQHPSTDHLLRQGHGCHLRSCSTLASKQTRSSSFIGVTMQISTVFSTGQLD